MALRIYMDYKHVATICIPKECLHNYYYTINCKFYIYIFTDVFS